jgi:hypothetical protein
MNRPALASAVLLGAALVTAGCGGGQASSPSAAPSSPAGTQSYSTMLDLYSAVLGTGTTCSDVSIEPATAAKAQASCDLGGGKSLLLQTWRNGAARDSGVHAVESTLAERHAPYCVLAGIGDTGLWSVAARGDAAVCTDISHKLGGTVTSSTRKG